MTLWITSTIKADRYHLGDSFLLSFFHYTQILIAQTEFVRTHSRVVLSLVWTPLRLRAYSVCVHLMYSLY